MGSTIASIGRPVSIHATANVSLNWFFPKNRPVITSFLMVVPPLGYIAGYSITSLLVTAGDNDDP